MTFTVSKTVSDETLDCIIQIESAGKPLAKAPTSSALGLGQFLDHTWLVEVQRHRPDVMAGKSQAQVLAMRRDPSFSIEILARFTEDNQHIVGMGCTGGDLYLAHFLGAGAAQAVYKASPLAPVGPIVGQAAVAANRSILMGKTCSQVRAWSAKRMAVSAGKGWVAKYYQPPSPDALFDAQTPSAESAEDFDDPQAQARPMTPDDAPPYLPVAGTPAADPSSIVTDNAGTVIAVGGFFASSIKLIKSRIAWASTAMGGISMASVTGFLTDWRTVAVIVLLLLFVIYYERNKKP